MTLSIRIAEPADIPALFTLEQSSTTAAHWSHDHYTDIFATATPTLMRRLALVAVDTSPSHGIVCGFLIARIVATEWESEWEIENIVVAESSRRQGIGSQLLTNFLTRAQLHPGTTAILEVRESNLPARKLYERFNFLAEGKRPNYYNNPLEDAVLYRLVHST